LPISNNITNSVQYLTQTQQASQVKQQDDEISKDQFLRLLVTQLRYQDPTQPMENKEFIAQMAQFTALEQTQNLNKSFEKSQAISLIGKIVTAKQPDSDAMLTDLVTGMKIVDGKTKVVLASNNEVELNNITQVHYDSNLGTMDEILAVLQEIKQRLVTDTTGGE